MRKLKVDEFRASNPLLSAAPSWQDLVMEWYALGWIKILMCSLFFPFFFLDQLSFDENKLKRHAWDTFWHDPEGLIRCSHDTSSRRLSSCSQMLLEYGHVYFSYFEDGFLKARNSDKTDHIYPRPIDQWYSLWLIMVWIPLRWLFFREACCVKRGRVAVKRRPSSPSPLIINEEM